MSDVSGLKNAGEWLDWLAWEGSERYVELEKCRISIQIRHEHSKDQVELFSVDDDPSRRALERQEHARLCVSFYVVALHVRKQSHLHCQMVVYEKFPCCSSIFRLVLALSSMRQLGRLCEAREFVSSSRRIHLAKKKR